ncbi:MAG: thiamine phosphate synthase [Vicinamibacteraceae bacterium]
MSLPRPCVCLVTDRSRLPPSIDTVVPPPALGPLVDRLVLAGEAGIDLLQIREPDLSAADLIGVVREVRARLAGAGARIVVNERVDVALAADADGVHLKADSIPTALVRQHVPAAFLVGRSVHTVDEARAAEAEGADYLIFGTVFPSGSKPRGHHTAGLDALTATAQAVSIPVLAIGGISLNTVAAAAEAGASGVAAIGLFFDAAGPMDDLRGRFIQTVAGLRAAFVRT